METVKNLVRKNILKVKPYSSARDEHSSTEGIFLDANENSLGSVIQNNLNRYPDPNQKSLKAKLSDIKKIPQENIFLGNGSDEAIDLLIRIFCEPGKDKILIMPPTYGMYEVCAEVNNIDVLKVPLNKYFSIQLDDMLHYKKDNSIKLIFICNPNNPTGNVFDNNTIEQIIKNFSGVVVIDEAYIDFSGKQSWSEKIEKYPNLVILQTMSKAWGLAALRIGMAFSNNFIISLLNKIKHPYNIGGINQKLALKAFENISIKENYVRRILNEKSKLANELEKLKIVQKIFPSETNYLLVKITDADKIHDFLISKKIIVRNRTKETNCEGCIRITVGNQDENKNLIKQLKIYESKI